MLNRWIVPLEKRYDLLEPAERQKDPSPVRSTDHLLDEPAAEGSRRRSVPATHSLQDRSRRSDRRTSSASSLRFSLPKFGFVYQEEPITYLIQKHYRGGNRPFRNCQPRDLLLQIRNFCRFMNRPPVLTNEYFDVAIENYFAVM